MVIDGPATRTRANAKAATSSVKRTSLNNNSTSSSNVTRRAVIPSTTKRVSLENKSISSVKAASISPIQFAELLARVSALEKANTELQNEVVELKATVTEQEATIRAFKLTTEASIRGVSIEQEEINCNIVIRGLETTENSSQEDLSCIYDGLRTHLSVSGVSELDPVELKVLPLLAGQDPATKRPLIVRLKSIAAKRTLLQVRRQKKDIFPCDIGLQQTSKRPILVTEHLTKENQNLLFQARSLRGLNRFKFVWSCNGQILVRRKKAAKVIRVSNLVHVNTLRGEIGLLPLYSDGSNNLRASSDPTSE